MKLPTLDERSIPTPASPGSVNIIQADTTQVAKATQQLGNELQNAGAAIYQVKDNIDKFNYFAAKSKFLRNSVDLENKIENNTDYANLGTKYQEEFAKIKSGAMESLGNGRYANHLASEIGIYESKALQKVNKLAEQKQFDFSIAKAQGDEEQNLDRFLRTKDPVLKSELIDSTARQYEAAIPDSNPQKNILVEKYKENIGKRFGIASFNQLSPSAQIKLLDEDKKKPDSNLARFIPADDRVILYDKAKQALDQEKNNLASKVRDQDFLKEHAAKENSLNAILNGGTVKDIPLDQYARLSEVDRANLNKVQQIKNGTLQIDPIEGIKSYNEYSDMYANNPNELAKIDPITIQSRVSPDKVNEVLGWKNKAMQGIPQNNTEKDFNGIANFYVKNIIHKSFKDEDANLFINKFREAKQEFADSKNRKPTNEELRHIANGLVAQKAIAGTFFGTNQKPVYKVGKENAPDNIKDEIIKQARKRNPNIILTDEQINQIYAKKLLNETIK